MMRLHGDPASALGDPADHAADVPPIDTSRPHSARIWNYWLGGKDNYQVDRDAGDRYMRAFPTIVTTARCQRLFLQRAVRYAVDAGVRQFLDIGTGLPTVDNTHQVAQRAAPEARVVYVDNDPLVLAHARALLTGRPEGATDYVDADLRDPDGVLSAAQVTLDLRQPVAVLLLGVLGHIPDTGEAREIVRTLVRAVPDGSLLAVCDGTALSTRRQAAHGHYDATGADPYVLRSPGQIAAFFDGLELLEPGVVTPNLWRPEIQDFGPSATGDTETGEVEARCGLAVIR